MKKITLSQIQHNFFVGVAYVLSEEERNVGFIYKLDDYFVLWLVDVEDELTKFLDECREGVHDTEGFSTTADTFLEALEFVLGE